MWSAGQAFLKHLFDVDPLSEDQERLHPKDIPLSPAEQRYLIGSTLILLGVVTLWLYLMLW